MTQLQTGITLGILGGGQLGRMSAIAAAKLGIKTIIFCPEENSPASHIANKTISANYDDKAALKEFSSHVDIVSYEFENIPLETIEILEGFKSNSVFPEKKLLEVSQDRVIEKGFLNQNSIETTRWVKVSSLEDIQKTAGEWNNGFIIKTARFGYDGKGQIKCDTPSDPALKVFLEQTTGQALIMEELVDFSCETSIVVARDKYKKTALYGPMLNEHKNHILHTTTIPAGISEEIITKSHEIAQSVANAVQLRGILTVEFFVCRDGNILVNEIAPRTHNSGHWTVDACAVSQFENHVRTVCGLPVGSSDRHSDAMMLNLIGDDVNNIDHHFNEPHSCIHLYGKKQARVGRKMGHITFLKQT